MLFVVRHRVVVAGVLILFGSAPADLVRHVGRHAVGRSARAPSDRRCVGAGSGHDATASSLGLATAVDALATIGDGATPIDDARRRTRC